MRESDPEIGEIIDYIYSFVGEKKDFLRLSIFRPEYHYLSFVYINSKLPAVTVCFQVIERSLHANWRR